MLKIFTICLVLTVLTVQYSGATSVYKALNPKEAHFLDEASPDSIIARKQRLAEELTEPDTKHNRDKRSWFSISSDRHRYRHRKCGYRFGSSEELKACNGYWGYFDAHGTAPPYYVRPFYGMPHPGAHGPAHGYGHPQRF